MVTVLSGCNSPGAREPVAVDDRAADRVEVRLDEPFTLAPGETAGLPGSVVTIEFVAVTSDSRCPVDVVCIWAGDAVVALAVRVAGAAGDSLELHTHGGAVGPRAADIAGYRLELVDLRPEQRSDEETPQDAYRATFTVTDQSG